MSRYTAFFTVICILLLLSSCSSKNLDDKGQQTKNEINQVMANASIEATPDQTLAPAPQDILDQLVPGSDDNIAGFDSQPVAIESRFDVSVSNAPAKVFFMSLVKGTDINMVVHPQVTGTISLDLKNVTVSDVMKLSREVYNYEYRKSAAGYIVLPSRLESKIFQVNYLNIVRAGESSMSVSSGQLSSSAQRVSSSSDTVEDDRTDSDSTVSNSTRSTTTEKSSGIVTINKVDFWTGLKLTVMSIIGGVREGRSVVVDSISGLVVVRAMPSELRDVADYLNQAQSNLQRQVIIEAKIIEVQLNDSFQSGIDWAALAKSSGRSLLVGQTGIIDGNSSVLDASGNFDATTALSSTGGGAFNNLFAVGAGNGSDFGALLRLLGTQGEVQVLSSPRVSTVNNQKAVIKVGFDEFFVTNVSSSTTSGSNTTTTTPDITLTPFFSGIALDVTPQISTDGDVIMHIHPSVSEVRDQTKTITLSGQVQQLPLALSTVRETDSVVRAKSGQVIVIGGLMQNSNSNDDAGVPGVSDVPILGSLFKQQRKSNSRSELIILLRPIVVQDKIWSEYIKDSADRIEQLQIAPKGE